MGAIDREDMLELTRRMTLGRNCFSRIAGAYFDSEGYVEGTFNIHFQKLSKSEQESKLKVAKAIPFAKTNEDLKEYRFRPQAQKQGRSNAERSIPPGGGSVRQFLRGVLNDELKNDAMLDVFYEMFGGRYKGSGDYGIYFFLGNYDIPKKGTDHVWQGESEEVFRFLICAVCPLGADYEPKAPECGFLYPAYKERGAAEDYIDVYQRVKHVELMELLGIAY